MGEPVAIAMLSKLSQETDLRLSKIAFPLHQVQRTSFLDPRADGYGLPAHPFDKILHTGNQLDFLTADQKMFTVKLFLGGELRNKTSFLLNFIKKNPCVRECKFDPGRWPYNQWWSNWI